MDILDVEILPDGRIKVTTDDISQPNHMNAENFMKFIAQATGSPARTTSRNKHINAHSHTHEHEHN